MIVHPSLDAVPAGRRSLALGSFDGVHRGHQLVIERAMAAAREHDAVSTVVTFHPHPMAVLRPEMAPHELSTLARRTELVSELGPDELVVLRFTREFSQIDAERFASEVLAEGLGAVHVTVGRNFRYGHRAQGGLASLTEAGERLGFGVSGMPLVELHGGPVSSSRIRSLIADGDVQTATELLGRPPWLEGEVTRGDGRGRGLGFPTANVGAAPRSALPGRGVYAGRARVDGASHVAAISVGYNPTFTDSRDAVRVEAHLLDFDRDIYGRHMLLEFTHRLRDEERFGTVDDLISQLHRDVLETRRLVARAGG
ncbi:MAG: bifunctional riboflavin kinase/FAD synthetase [Gaiellales bacterium]